MTRPQSTARSASLVRPPFARAQPERAMLACATLASTLASALALLAMLARPAAAQPTHAQVTRESAGTLAPAAPAAAAADVVTVTVTPELQGDSLVALDVEMTFRGDDDGWTVFLLPGATARGPRHWETVSGLVFDHATAREDGGDRRILLHAPGATIRARYRVSQKFQGRTSVTIIEPDFFSTIGSALFGDVENRHARTVFRWGSLPRGWQVGSDLEQGDGARPLEWRDFYTSTLIGGARVHVEERRAGAGRLRIAMHPGLELDPARFADLVALVADRSNRFWEDAGRDHFVSVTTIGMRAQAGLGRGDGYALYLPARPDTLELRGTIAHEHLHGWFGARFGNGNAWFREGFTEYFAGLVNLRAGDYALETFAARWNDALLRYAQSPLQLSPDSAAERLFATDADAERLGEDRGAMLAALLDHRLRTASGGTVDLRRVLLAVKREVDEGAGSGDGPRRLVRHARAMAGVDLQPMLDAHLARGEPLRLPRDLFGACATVETVEIPRYDRGFARIANGVVAGVDTAHFAYAAGLRDGMTLLARVAGVPGDSRVETAFRVRDGDAERVLRWYPVGREYVTVQEIQLAELDDARRAECVRAITNVD